LRTGNNLNSSAIDRIASLTETAVRVLRVIVFESGAPVEFGNLSFTTNEVVTVAAPSTRPFEEEALEKVKVRLSNDREGASDALNAVEANWRSYRQEEGCR
jgi:hypothetical protein